VTISFSKYTVQLRMLLNGQTWAPRILQAISVGVKGGGKASHGIVLNTPYHFGIDRCQSYLKSCHEIAVL
jgi:hypothetical protein